MIIRFISLSSLLFSILILAHACKKEVQELPIIPPIDEPQDTTTVITPPAADTTKLIEIMVRESQTLLPAANRVVVLYQVTYAGTYPFLNIIDSLGTTDAQGKLLYKWNKKPLPPNTKMGFSRYPSLHQEHNDFLPLSIGTTLASPLIGDVLAAGYAKIRIQFNKTDLQYPNAELVVFKTPPYNPGDISWVPEFSFDATQPFDTTVVVKKLAPRGYQYAVRYGYDKSSYGGYISGNQSEKVSINFQQRDTAKTTITVPQ